MALERIVRECLADAAAREGVPSAAAKRLAALTSAVADGEVDPQTETAEMARRIELLLAGFDAT